MIPKEYKKYYERYFTSRQVAITLLNRLKEEYIKDNIRHAFSSYDMNIIAKGLEMDNDLIELVIKRVSNPNSYITKQRFLGRTVGELSTVYYNGYTRPIDFSKLHDMPDLEVIARKVCEARYDNRVKETGQINKSYIVAYDSTLEVIVGDGCNISMSMGSMFDTMAELIISDRKSQVDRVLTLENVEITDLDGFKHYTAGRVLGFIVPKFVKMNNVRINPTDDYFIMLDYEDEKEIDEFCDGLYLENTSGYFVTFIVKSEIAREKLMSHVKNIIVTAADGFMIKELAISFLKSH